MTIVAIKGVTAAQCDAEGCETIAPDPGQYMIDHKLDRWPGWNSLGWYCSGGKHYCPTHAKEKV